MYALYDHPYVSPELYHILLCYGRRHILLYTVVFYSYHILLYSNFIYSHLISFYTLFSYTLIYSMLSWIIDKFIHLQGEGTNPGPDGQGPGPIGVTYPGTDTDGLQGLTDRSTYCTQDIMYSCDNSPIHVAGTFRCLVCVCVSACVCVWRCVCCVFEWGRVCLCACVCICVREGMCEWVCARVWVCLLCVWVREGVLCVCMCEGGCVHVCVRVWVLWGSMCVCDWILISVCLV